jgi:hypothetical protein
MERKIMTDVLETPSTAVAGAAQDKVLVTDDRGRVIAVQKLNLLNYYFLTKAMGDSASNASLMDMAITAASVRGIDTTKFAMPNTETDVRLLLQMLDFDGLKAAGEGLRQLHTKASDGAEAAKNLAGNPASN